MLLESQNVPNEPALLVVVSFERPTMMQFGRHAGKSIAIPVQLIGASAREVSCELSEAEQRESPVVWRFWSGSTSGGDDPKSEPPWSEYRFEVSSEKVDARDALEEALDFGRNFTWYVVPKRVWNETKG